MNSTQMMYIRGTQILPAGVILLCRVENGEEWIPSFLAHYRSIGIGHMVFLDTGSTDRTLELLTGNNVTVYATSASFKTERLQMRQWLMDLCPPHTWTLNVDIDELFVFPSGVTSPTPNPSPDGGGGHLDRLIEYMDDHGYTAMRAHMLDMFASGPVGSSDASPPASLLEQYPYYDLSAVHPLDQPTFFGTDLPAYSGGIRKTIFDRDCWLTKHPLIKTGNGIAAFDQNEHSITDGRLADATAALLHFKFTTGFAHYVDESVRRGQHWNNSDEYRAYQSVLADDPVLSLKRETAKRWNGVDQLVEEGFLQVSEVYRQEIGSSTSVGVGASADVA